MNAHATPITMCTTMLARIQGALNFAGPAADSGSTMNCITP
jgi:hypothetical protein